MSGWIVICIVCFIYTLVMMPIERRLKKRFSNKYIFYALSFLIGFVILMTLYCIADLLHLSNF